MALVSAFFCIAKPIPRIPSIFAREGVMLTEPEMYASSQSGASVASGWTF